MGVKWEGERCLPWDKEQEQATALGLWNVM